MSDIKISQLPLAGSLADSDVVVGVNGSATRAFQLLDIATYIQGKVTNGIVVSNTLPTSPVVGETSWNPTSGQMRVFDGSVWKWIGGASVISHLQSTAATSIAPNTFNQVSMTEVNVSTNGIGHSGSAGYVTVLETGIYDISIKAGFQNQNTLGSRGIWLYVGSSDWTTAGKPTGSAGWNVLASVGSASGTGTKSNHFSYVSASTTLSLPSGTVVTPLVGHSADANISIASVDFIIRLVGY